MSRGRGRGGFGRGGGGKEPWHEMGFTEAPTVITQPPPLYPLMEQRPVPLTPSVETDYLLITRQLFITRMQLAPSYLKMPHDKDSDKAEEDLLDCNGQSLVAQLPSSKEKYDWRLYPSELRPKMVAKRVRIKKEVKDVDVKKVLETLEKVEEGAVKREFKEEPADAEANEDPTKAEEEEELEEEEEDDEMDGGTDYVNNYFDNGDEYEDDDEEEAFFS